MYDIGFLFSGSLIFFIFSHISHKEIAFNKKSNRMVTYVHFILNTEKFTVEAKLNCAEVL